MTEPVQAKPITALTIAGIGLAIGLALVLAGITLGFVEASSGCGSAFSATDAVFAPDYCEAATSARKGIALALIVPGAMLTLWAAVYAGTLGALKVQPSRADTPKPTE